MRLLHEVYEELPEATGGDFAPLRAVLSDLLEGPRGNLPDLIDRFTEAGLASIMASWVEGGPCLPVTADQLRTVLGSERVRDFATLAGLPEQELLTRLAHRLPARDRP